MIPHQGAQQEGPLPPEERPPMSFSEKQKVASDITKLAGKDIVDVIKIIKESMPGLGENGDEDVELDVEKMDDTTLWKLSDFLKNKQKAKPKSKPKSKKASGSAGWRNTMGAASRATDHSYQQLQDARAATGAASSSSGAMGGGGYDEYDDDDFVNLAL